MRMLKSKKDSPNNDNEYRVIAYSSVVIEMNGGVRIRIAK